MLNPGRGSSRPLALFGLRRLALAKHPRGRYAPPGLLVFVLLAGRPFKLAPSRIALGMNFPFPERSVMTPSGLGPFNGADAHPYNV